MPPLSILIAEDESIIALDIKGLLLRAGYKVHSVVRDGDSLLEILNKELPSLIIMDIHLKGKTDGISAANEIWKKCDIPIVFISGLDYELIKKKLDFSKCEIVKKPFKETELLKAIKRFFPQNN